MSNTTIIIGNGIGMALDPDYFQLESGINFVINKLTKKEKKLIRFKNESIPSSEEQLEDYHNVLTACNQLYQYVDTVDFLKKTGKNFPNVYQDFIYKISKYFFDYNLNSSQNFDMFTTFISHLASYISSNNTTHIATLNYDKLIYESLISKQLLAGYDSALVDGIYVNKSGFSEENMIPKYGNNFGWYLHLHGSPIYKTVSDGRNINKSRINELPECFNNNGSRHNHIVLANTDIKPSIISGSSLLDSYFNFFIKAIYNSQKIIILGYSGLDKHINFEIMQKIERDKSTIIEIIQWSGDSDNNEAYWKEKFGISHSSFKLIQLDNILNYDFNDIN